MDRSKIILVLAVVLAVIIAAIVFHYLPRLSSFWQQADERELQRREVPFIAQDLTRRLADIEQRSDFTSDLSFSLFENGEVSFHVHAMQARQICPLHVHNNSEECDFIIKGKAKIHSVVTEEGGSRGPQRRGEILLEKNGLFYAPPGSPHEFLNATDEVLACLVISTPPFQGNLYLKEDSISGEPWSSGSSGSTICSYQDLSSRADSMVGAGAGQVAVGRVDAFKNVEMRLMRTSSPLDENMARGHDLVIIYFRGEALFEILDRKIELHPTYFLGIPVGTKFRITPREASQDSCLLCIYLRPS
ncbi:MAG: cupin domain-containing protein [Acidobacteriota bacterium]